MTRHASQVPEEPQDHVVDIQQLIFAWQEYEDISISEAQTDINTTLKDQQLQLLQRVRDEVIGEDEELQIPNPGVDNFRAVGRVERSVGRNQAKYEMRTKLNDIEREIQ